MNIFPEDCGLEVVKAWCLITDLNNIFIFTAILFTIVAIFNFIAFLLLLKCRKIKNIKYKKC